MIPYEIIQLIVSQPNAEGLRDTENYRKPISHRECLEAKLLTIHMQRVWYTISTTLPDKWTFPISYGMIGAMPILENKKARFNYEIMETFEAGMELLGIEVKSLRNKHGSIEGAHIVIRGGEAFLLGASIPAYQPNNTTKNYDERRTRKLLLTKKEIARLGSEEGKKGLTIVPLSVYNKGRKIKIEIGIARGKKLHDKRLSIKKREAEREIRRTLKGE